MKLELTVRTLERLIGGDTEIEVHIRQQIVQEFARRHFIALAKTELFDAAVAEATKIFAAAAKDTIDLQKTVFDEVWPVMSQRLTALITRHIQDSTQKYVNEIFRSVEDAEFQRRLTRLQAYVDDRVERAMASQIERRIADGIQQRLDAAAKLPG